MDVREDGDLSLVPSFSPYFLKTACLWFLLFFVSLTYQAWGEQRALNVLALHFQRDPCLFYVFDSHGIFKQPHVSGCSLLGGAVVIFVSSQKIRKWNYYVNREKEHSTLLQKP